MITEKEMFVQVSKYVSKSWFDPISQMWFRSTDGIIPIPAGTDTTNIHRYLELNYLEDKTPAPLKKKPVSPEVERFTPGQLLAIKDHEPLPKEAVKESVPEAAEEKVPDTEITEEAQIDGSPSDEDEVTAPEKVACQYCGEEYSPRGIKIHEKSCKAKPEQE